MKIAVVTPVLSIAGVPLAQLRFARALASRGHEVELVVGWIDPSYELPDLPGVVVVELGKRHVRQMLWSLIGYLRRTRPHVAFVAEDHLSAVTLLAAVLSGSRAKFSCSSRVTPFDTYSDRPFTKRWILKQVMRVAMRRADVLTCVSQDMVDQYRKVFPAAPHECVYNIVVDRASRTRMAEPLEHPWCDDPERPLVVAAGRLAPWKGFPDLIRAMALGPAARGARLLILGDGAQREELQGLVDELDLRASVRLEGYVSNPLKYFSSAKVFVLSSLVEGLPNVLVEAMMCGCTPVATDCPTGPREVLADGRVGHLVPVGDSGRIACAILAALEDPVRPELLHAAIAPFHEDVVIDRHFQLLGLSEPSAALASLPR